MTSGNDSSQPVVQLAPRGTIIRADAAQMRALRDQFAEQHFVRLPQLLAPELLDRVLGAIDSAQFAEGRHGEELREDRLSTSSLASMTLHFVTNSPTFIAFISSITQCSAIGSFHGRVFRRLATLGHYSEWHSDTFIAGRPAAMSLNLGDAYRGGDLELRRVGTSAGTVIPNRRLGDAVVFRIAPDLEHRVQPVDGTVFRTAFAGWFYETSMFDDVLRRVVTSAPP
jgi:hypothetical protein